MTDSIPLRSRSVVSSALFSIVLVCAITACGDKKSSAARADRSGNTPRDCADVRGNYSLASSDAVDGQFDVAATFIGANAPSHTGDAWRTVTIDGNADTQLELTFARPASRSQPTGDRSVPAYIRQAMETTQTRVVDEQKVTVQRGLHYDCKGGWLVGPAKARVQRDASGDLVGRLEERQARVISVWAETGAGIPYWFDTTTRAARWLSIGASDIGQTQQRSSTRFEQQERAQEQGTSAGGNADSGWSQSGEAALRALVDRNAEVDKIVFDGKRYVLTLIVESRGPATRTLENLRANPIIKDVQDHGMITASKGRDIATISARIVR